MTCTLNPSACSLRCSCSSVNTGCVTGVIMSLPVRMVDVWAVNSFNSDRFITGEHLCPAALCSSLPVCTAQWRRRRRRRCVRPPPSGCHGDRSVFWSMTGSTWKNGAAVVAVSLRMQPRFVLLSPGFPLRHVRTGSQSPVEAAGGAL